eukprot:6058369-Pyramimonas_sp.AAC.1
MAWPLGGMWVGPKRLQAIPGAALAACSALPSMTLAVQRHMDVDGHLFLIASARACWSSAGLSPRDPLRL